MSRLYDALTAIENRAPSKVPRVDLPRVDDPVRSRRPRALAPAAIGIGIVVVLGGVLLKVLGGSTPTPMPAEVKPTVTAAPPIPAAETVNLTDMRARARAAATTNALEEAQNLLERAVAISPTEAESWNDLGVVLVRRGRLTRGIEAFERAISLQDTNAEAHRNLAVALDRDGQREAADRHYRAFLALSPQHADRAAVERRLGVH